MFPVFQLLFLQEFKKSKNPGWSFRQIEGLEPSGVLPLNSPRRVSMTQASISLYFPTGVPIMKNRYQEPLQNQKIEGGPSPTILGAPQILVDSSIGF